MTDVRVLGNDALAAALEEAGFAVERLDARGEREGPLLVVAEGEGDFVCAAAVPPWHLLAMLAGWGGPGMPAAYAAETAGAASPIMPMDGGVFDVAYVLPHLARFYTLVCTDTEIATAPLQAAAGIAGMPLTVLDVRLDMPARLTLVRADRRVCWWGDALPDDLAGFVGV